MYVHGFEFLNIREAIFEAGQPLHACVDTVLDVAEVNIKVGGHQKNEQMNSFLLVCNVFSFVLLKNPRPEKNISRFTDL